MNKSFWKNRRVLITGHTGFKGGWLALLLKFLGADVTGYSLNAPTKPNFFELCKVDKCINSVIGDVRNLENLSVAIEANRPEIIFHLAAQSLVRESYINPVETYSTNLLGTLNIMESGRLNNGVKVIINVTSDKCYENKSQIWPYKETDRLGGFDPYSNSKACSELITSCYSSSFFASTRNGENSLAVATARAGNVIGGGDWAKDRLFTDMINALENELNLSIRNPNATRPWQHVLEPLHGYIILAEKLYDFGPKYSGAWNFGPDSENIKEVIWVAENFIKMWGGKSKVLIDTSNQPYEAQILKLDNTKSKTYLNWRPILNINESLKLVVDWKKRMTDGDDMYSVTMEQINKYSEYLNKGKI